MRILDTTVTAALPTSGATAFAAILLTAGKHYDEAKTGILKKSKNDLAPLWSLADDFVYGHGGAKRAWRLFRNWCDSPPTASSDDEEYGPYEDALKEVRSKKFRDRVKNDGALTQEQAQVALDALAWCVTGSQTAFLRIRKLGTSVGLPASVLSLLFVESGTQDKEVKTLTALYRKYKLPIRPDLRLTVGEATAFAEEYPEEAKRMSDMRKNALKVFKTELMNFIRGAGGPQPVEHVRKHMQAQGILVTRLPPDVFRGQIGEDGKLFTTAGEPIDGGYSDDMVLNPNYDPQKDNGYVYKYKATPDSPGWTTVFTRSWNQRSDDKTFKLAQELEDNLDTVRSKLMKAMRGSDRKSQVLAAMLELQYLTAMRIGNPGGATKGKDGVVEPTYGLTTLEVQHVRVRGPGLVIVFHGKSAVEATYTVTPVDARMKLVINIVKSLLVNEDGSPKAKTDYVFEDRSGRYNSARVNKYLRSITGITGITNHKIRHMRGTALARTAIADIPMRLTQDSAEHQFLDAMTKVGKLLNHVKGVVGGARQVTPDTAIKNYVDPKLMLDFFRTRGLRIPKKLQQFANR